MRGKHTIITANKQDSFFVIVEEDKVVEGYRYIKGTYQDKTYLYKQIKPGKWVKVLN